MNKTQGKDVLGKVAGRSLRQEDARKARGVVESDEVSVGQRIAANVVGWRRCGREPRACRTLRKSRIKSHSIGPSVSAGMKIPFPSRKYLGKEMNTGLCSTWVAGPGNKSSFLDTLSVKTLSHLLIDE